MMTYNQTILGTTLPDLITRAEAGDKEAMQGL